MPPIQGATIKYTDVDEHILRRLACAVVYQWDELPENIQNLLLEQAPFMTDRHENVQLAQQLKLFIEAHKPENRESADE